MIKAIFRSPVTTVVLFVVAAALLLGGTIGAVSAAPRIQSADYRAQVELTNIETALIEKQGGTWANGKYSGGSFVEVVGDDAIAQKFVTEAGDSSLKLGKTYNEQLAVRNVGTIDQYVRVFVKKYWVLTDENGNPLTDAKGKKVELDPDLIGLHFVTGNGWTIDEGASTEEQTVLYYNKSIAPGEETSPFTDTLTIDSSIASKVKKIDGVDTYTYDGVQFRIKAQVDAVQTHNANDAMTSAWGRTNK